jgi:hypothetical protein
MLPAPSLLFREDTPRIVIVNVGIAASVGPVAAVIGKVTGKVIDKVTGKMIYTTEQQN